MKKVFSLCAGGLFLISLSSIPAVAEEGAEVMNEKKAEISAEAPEAGVEAEETASVRELTAEMKLGSGIEERVITGEAEVFTTDSVDKVYCWSKITGAEEPTTIKHIWYLGDKVISEVELAINYSSHRTWSYKTMIPEFAGNWKVEAVDADGNLLGVKTFSVE